MGCAPSKSSIDILVEQQQSKSEPLEPVEKPFSPTSSQSDSLLEKSFLQEDFPDEGFLQESIKSGTSHNSSTSWDSGMYELDDEYSYIITENSDPRKVQEVNSQFLPGDGIELLLEGKACPRKISSRDRDKMEQQAILEVLREEGVIIRPVSRAVGGISFDFLLNQKNSSMESSLNHKLPPLKIRKKYKRKKAELTYEEIEQKLIKAEERRKLKTEEKLNKVAVKDWKEIQAVTQQQKEIERQKIEEKLQAKTHIREKHLNELQDKLKAREDHARKVRERKQMQENGYKYIMPPWNPMEH